MNTRYFLQIVATICCFYLLQYVENVFSYKGDKDPRVKESTNHQNFTWDCFNGETPIAPDQYVNRKISQFEPPSQVGGTCYANAAAAALYFAMNRIFCRQDGVPDFDLLRQEIIEVYGDAGAHSGSVLTAWTPKYRLHFKVVDELGAKQAINAGRQVVASFWLSRKQWCAFGNFYNREPKGILEKKHLLTDDQCDKIRTPQGILEKFKINLWNYVDSIRVTGHAVVLMKYDSHSLTFMNSWGKTWADNGFFKVHDPSVLNFKFYDIYWTLDDLYQSEKEAYEQHKLKYG